VHAWIVGDTISALGSEGKVFLTDFPPILSGSINEPGTTTSMKVKGGPVEIDKGYR
jgi:hypothetical protein